LAVLPKANPLIIPSPKGASSCSYDCDSFILGFKLATGSETKVVLDGGPGPPPQRVRQFLTKEPGSMTAGIANAIPLAMSSMVYCFLVPMVE
jgi:hypothetical protein